MKTRINSETTGCHLGPLKAGTTPKLDQVAQGLAQRSLESLLG